MQKGVVGLTKKSFSSLPQTLSFQGRQSSLLKQSTTAEDTNKNLLDLSHYDNLQSFNGALRTIAVQCNEDNIDVISRATVAEALLYKLNMNADSSFQADTESYNLLLKIWTRGAAALSEGKGVGDINQVYHALDDIPEELAHEGVYSAKDAAERSSSILNDMVERYLRGDSVTAVPTTESFNLVIQGWIRSYAGAELVVERVLDLFDRMKEWSESGVTGSDEDDHIVNGDAGKWIQISPNTDTYSSVIDTYAQVNDGQVVVTEVEKLLDFLRENYDENGDDTSSLKPTIKVANAAIIAISKYKPDERYKGKHEKWDKAKKAQEIYNEWRKIYKKSGDDVFKPNCQTYTSVISAYSRCGCTAAAERAQGLFDALISEYETSGDKHMKPIAKTFTELINAWAYSNDPKSGAKTDALIQIMEDMYEDDVKNKVGGTSGLKPNSRTYGAAILAWGRSSNPQKPQRILQLLKSLNDHFKKSGDKSMKPTLHTYNTAIDACTKCRGSTEEQTFALKVAFAINKAIFAAGIEPNYVSYRSLLKAASNLVPPGEERNAILKAVFDKCKNAGQVDDTVLKTLQMGDLSTFYDIVKVTRKNVPLDALPREWSRNIS